MSSTELFKKHFGENVASVDLKHPNMEDFFNDLNEECLEEDRNAVKEIIMSSPALQALSEHYPPNRYGKVPLKIKMAITVKSDLPIFLQSGAELIAHEGKEYFVWVNSHGAMSAILPNGEKLGIRPSECEIIEWHS